MVRRVDDIESLVLSLCDARMRGGVWEEKRISRGVGVGESESENEFTDIDGVRRVYLFIYSCGTVGHRRGVLVFEWTVKF